MGLVGLFKIGLGQQYGGSNVMWKLSILSLFNRLLVTDRERFKWRRFRQVVVPNKPSPQGSKGINWWSYVINGEKDERVLGKRLNKLSVKKIMQ